MVLARDLLNPRWPAVDRLLFYALVVGSVLLAAWGVAPEVARELTPTVLVPPAGPGLMPAAAAASLRAAAFGPGAWWLAGVLGVVLLAGLWDRWRTAEVLAAAALVIGAACLLAGRYDAQLAVASALRWNLAIALLLVSAVVWFRASLTAAPARRALSPGDRRGGAGPHARLVVDRLRSAGAVADRARGLVGLSTGHTRRTTARFMVRRRRTGDQQHRAAGFGRRGAGGSCRPRAIARVCLCRGAGERSHGGRRIRAGSSYRRGKHRRDANRADRAARHAGGGCVGHWLGRGAATAGGAAAASPNRRWPTSSCGCN